jgi:hypothetical protein
MTANDTVQTSQPMEDWRSLGLGRSLSSILRAAAGLPPRAPPSFRAPGPHSRSRHRWLAPALLDPRRRRSCSALASPPPRSLLETGEAEPPWRLERRSLLETGAAARRHRACAAAHACSRCHSPTPAHAHAVVPCTVDARRAAARVWIPSSVFRRGRGEERGPTTDV